MTNNSDFRSIILPKSLPDTCPVEKRIGGFKSFSFLVLARSGQAFNIQSIGSFFMKTGFDLIKNFSLFVKSDASDRSQS